MQGDESPTWGDVWERSHGVHAPRFEWPELVKDIARAAGMPEEEIAAWPPPTEEITLASLCRGMYERARERQRRALLDWFGWDLAAGLPSAKIRDAFNTRGSKSGTGSARRKPACLATVSPAFHLTR